MKKPSTQIPLVPQNKLQLEPVTREVLTERNLAEKNKTQHVIELTSEASEPRYVRMKRGLLEVARNRGYKVTN